MFQFLNGYPFAFVNFTFLKIFLLLSKEISQNKTAHFAFVNVKVGLI